MTRLSFPVAGGVFTARFWPSVITFCLLVTLLGLGTWQLHRLAWKEALIADIEARQHEAPRDVLELYGAYKTDKLAYRPAYAGGEAGIEKELYLSAISLDGRGGYHVLLPVRLKSGDWLLVDRGWIPYDLRPKQDEEGTGYRPPESTYSVRGLLRVPNKPGWFAPANQPATNDWYSFDMPAMAKALGVPTLLPVVLEAEASPDPDAYPVGGQTRLDLPNDHLGYAITWYSLALTLLVIYGLAGWKREQKE